MDIIEQLNSVKLPRKKGENEVEVEATIFGMALDKESLRTLAIPYTRNRWARDPWRPSSLRVQGVQFNLTEMQG